MPIDFDDPKLLAQMALTHMVQRSQAGRVTAKSGFIIENRQAALETVEILNHALGSVPNCCFSIGEDNKVTYSGDNSLYIPNMLLQVKSGVYNKKDGSAATLSDILNNIKNFTLHIGEDFKSSNDNITEPSIYTAKKTAENAR